ncbi:MAG TPA: HIT family protein [Acidimicrobiaceae bacterium]|nr:HIT family protein [Acidimicrobiaceae bacterium]
MTTVFTRIIDGDIPGTFIWRDNRCVAFMSINPMSYGHALVVPIAEVDHWVDLEPDLSKHLFAVAHYISKAQNAAFSPERVGLIIAGYEVPHTHIHVLPTNEMSDLSFSNAATSVDREDLENAASAIHQQLVALGHDTGVTR